MALRIKVRQNGPYVVETDDVTVVDWNGNAYEPNKLPIALCRCGGSANKPFCDGSHRRNGFSASEEAGMAGGPGKPGGG